MIRVSAPRYGTAALTRGRRTELASLRAIRATRTLTSTDFSASVYASPALKEKLWRLQHGKCCYCERYYERRYSDVEHFRPKTEVRRAPRTKPAEGYWWLAYDIDNLYFACPSCNRAKGRWFPLVSGAGLVPEQHPRAVPEFPMLLEPRRDDIDQHLTFERLPNGKYQIAPRNGSQRGAETIRILGLDRDDLSELRNGHLRRHVMEVLRRTKGPAPERARAERQAARLAADDAEFALLVRTIFSAAKVPHPAAVRRQRSP